VVSSLQVFRQKFCIHLSYLCVLHATTINMWRGASKLPIERSSRPPVVSSLLSPQNVLRILNLKWLGCPGSVRGSCTDSVSSRGPDVRSSPPPTHPVSYPGALSPREKRLERVTDTSVSCSWRVLECAFVLSPRSLCTSLAV
jgi:hypothetical protein